MDLQQLTVQMQRQGMRRLLVISGDALWCQQQVETWQAQLTGDWLWVGEAAAQEPHCAPGALRNLLGQEFRHAVFDARHGFHAEAFAALAGTLLAGSWLLLLAPPWQAWSAAIDRDSLRWNDAAEAIATPNFVTHLQQQLLSDKRVAILRQDAPFSLQPLSAAADWQPEGEQQQQRLLKQLLAASPGVSVLTAARGRGKSALAGMLAQRWPGKCWVTAPAKVSTDVLAQFAGDAFEFYAPDALLAACASQPPTQIDWLLIDEAAAIPTPMLQRLISYFPRVLLTTTVQGYEGTGRGFLLKFCAALPQAQFFTLDQPLRWAPSDPLERFIDRSLLFDESDSLSSSGEVHLQRLEQHDWQTRPASLAALYQLLASAHYRTSPLDLRRMMDAQGMHFVAAYCQQQVIAALWLVDEGGLSAELAAAVWAGLRRPRGNLVAQSLAAHSGFPEAAQLRSRRVSRIAITPSRRRSGLGRQLITQCIADAAGLDFLSVSFGYTDELWQFWHACGFQLARIGTQREASSGCYSAMALLPLSDAGRDLTQRAVKRLARDYYWLQQQLDQPLTIASDLQQELNSEDWREVAGFACAHRPFEAAMPALGRLLARSSLPLPALRGAITQRFSVGELCRSLGLAGRKALLQCWRQEARLALADVDPSGAISEQISEDFPLPDGRGA
ncbi:tRNA(Met) cytidine acetyltransferase [Erwinia toletana]|uniref:tRNA(Met) cytidine acetyltransferase TmcA n=1 Tax=Winslowiella toletana TaxID=92490 RepID=A0ABS4P5B7_9GAMM|nr:GNAT family N-acetyltransferase [Winslowiella toletana]MBP2167826.1 tRNA(Met) cytidine acetyltransferase [Winslowiella toletana]